MSSVAHLPVNAWRVSGQGAPVVFVVHRDASMRSLVASLLERQGYRVHAFDDAGTFLMHAGMDEPACVVLDLDQPIIDGTEVQALVSRRCALPLIATARAASVRTTVHAMKAGAVEFLTQPFDEQLLFAAVREAIDCQRNRLAQQARSRLLRDRFASLSRREREVMQLVVGGRMNKHVAEALGISEITVKAHRGRMMRKMQAASLPHLVNMAALLSVGCANESTERSPARFAPPAARSRGTDSRSHDPWNFP